MLLEFDWQREGERVLLSFGFRVGLCVLWEYPVFALIVNVFMIMLFYHRRSVDLCRSRLKSAAI